MLQVSEVAFTGYPVTDMKRARAFYENTLGLKPAMVGGEDRAAWVEYEIGSSTFAISNMAPDWKPSGDGPAISLEVVDFDSSIQWLRDHGVRFVLEPVPTPVCRMAVVADPDGNSVIIHKRNGEYGQRSPAA